MGLLIILACIGLFLLFGVEFLYVAGFILLAWFILIYVATIIAKWDLKRVCRRRGMSEESIMEMMEKMV